MRWSNCATAASALSAIATLSSGALAQSAADFYKGKTVTYIVAIGPGGGADFFGRLATRHMQRVMPDTQFIVKNVRRRRGGAGQGDHRSVAGDGVAAQGSCGHAVNRLKIAVWKIGELSRAEKRAPFRRRA